MNYSILLPFSLKSDTSFTYCIVRQTFAVLKLRVLYYISSHFQNQWNTFILWNKQISSFEFRLWKQSTWVQNLVVSIRSYLISVTSSLLTLFLFVIYTLKVSESTCQRIRILFQRISNIVQKEDLGYYLSAATQGRIFVYGMDSRKKLRKTAKYPYWSNDAKEKETQSKKGLKCHKRINGISH